MKYKYRIIEYREFNKPTIYFVVRLSRFFPLVPFQYGVASNGHDCSFLEAFRTTDKNEINEFLNFLQHEK
jgi:hypothetical protein